MIRAIYFLLVGTILPFNFTLGFVTHSITGRAAHRKFIFQPLSGVPEWKAKFSSENKTRDAESTEPTLPLLLFPFEPTQLPLPGQHTKLTFRHGKFMDMIDESLTSYEGVVGMSVVEMDGLLPIVVLCEVIEEEVEVKSGFRGVLSMEVGLRAVGRMRRAQHELTMRNNSELDGAFHGRKVLNDIQIGYFEEYHDDVLVDEAVVTCQETLESIENLLGLSPKFLTLRGNGHELSEKQRCYDDAYNYLASQMANLHHGKLVAASWAVFALLDDDTKISSVITRALTTKNTAERLRLGLAAILDSISTTTASFEFNENNAFQ